MKNIKIVNNFTVKKSESRFGIVRTIFVGTEYHLIIGPKRWSRIEKLRSYETVRFHDEDREIWEVWFDEADNYNFFHPRWCKLITVEREDLV